MTHLHTCCGLLLRNLAAGVLLHVCHGLLLSCATSCAAQIWIATCSNLMCNKLRKRWTLIGQLLFVFFRFVTRLSYVPCFSRCSIHQRVQTLRSRLFMAALCNRAGHIYFHPVISFYLLLSFFYSSPNLSGHRLDVYHTSTHGVALVRI